MKKPGILGKIDASTTRRPSTPWTLKSVDSTPPSLAASDCGTCTTRDGPTRGRARTPASSLVGDMRRREFLGGDHALALRPAASFRASRTPVATALRSSPSASLPSSKYRKLIARRHHAGRRLRSVTSPAVLLVCALSTTQVRQFGFFAQQRRVAGEVAVESAEQARREQIRRRRARVPERSDHRKDRAVGRVDAVSAGRPIRCTARRRCVKVAPSSVFHAGKFIRLTTATS